MIGKLQTAMKRLLLRRRETAEQVLAPFSIYGRYNSTSSFCKDSGRYISKSSLRTSIQGAQVTYLLIVTMSACIGCKAVLVVSLLVGLLAALAGEAFLSAAAALIGDVLPNKDSSTWLFLPTVRYLSAA